MTPLPFDLRPKAGEASAVQTARENNASQMGKIIRDKDGNIIAVELPEESPERQTPSRTIGDETMVIPARSALIEGNKRILYMTYVGAKCFTGQHWRHRHPRLSARQDTHQAERLRVCVRLWLLMGQMWRRWLEIGRTMSCRELRGS